jgi:putative oxidoreductase
MVNNIGKLLLRIELGGMLLFHGIYKVQHGVATIQTMLHNHGMPEFLAYGVFLGEIFAPILLILGVYSRFWAGIIFTNMIMAFYLTNFRGLSTIGSYGTWGAESIMFYILTSIAIMLIGSGAYAIRRD